MRRKMARFDSLIMAQSAFDGLPQKMRARDALLPDCHQPLRARALVDDEIGYRAGMWLPGAASRHALADYAAKVT